jgi:hypothetical protein
MLLCGKIVVKFEFEVPFSLPMLLDGDRKSAVNEYVGYEGEGLNGGGHKTFIAGDVFVCGFHCI